MDSKTPPEQPRQIYVLRASIAEIRPQIWRKLSVPGGCTLGDLHWILQAAFGWDNDHMHSFTVNSEEYGMTGSDFGSGDDYDVTDEDDVCLDDLELQPKQKFTYLYDFGDSWKHDISVSQIVPGGLEDKGTERPRCLGGQRAGPLEDSGGPWGYMDMIEILKDPSHERYEEFHEWAGDRDPEYFDPEQVNARLDHAFKPPPPKARKKAPAGKTKKQT